MERKAVAANSELFHVKCKGKLTKYRDERNKAYLVTLCEIIGKNCWFLRKNWKIEVYGRWYNNFKI